MNGPYAPLRRYGNYVVVAKSQKYRDAESAGPVDAKLMASDVIDYIAAQKTIAPKPEGRIVFR